MYLPIYNKLVNGLNVYSAFPPTLALGVLFHQGTTHSLTHPFMHPCAHTHTLEAKWEEYLTQGHNYSVHLRNLGFEPPTFSYRVNHSIILSHCLPIKP